VQCLSPRTVGFKSDGKTISFSPKHYSKEYATFQIPCSKCRACRLEYARQTAIRCVHEASLYEKNVFLTLTYSEENLSSDKLQYAHFQKFVKDLRTYRYEQLLDQMFPRVIRAEQRRLWRELPKSRRDDLYETIRISVFCAGEYGDRKKRPHWHALIFNYRPSDGVHKYTSENGDKVESSQFLSQLWPHGIIEYGTVSYDSASYCARYALKKLYHGKDGEHEYNPISRRSSANAIGKRWIEKNWQDVFNEGKLVFKKGDQYKTCGIPRYYEKWLKKYQPDAWKQYVTHIKPKIMAQAIKKEENLTQFEREINFKRQARQGLQYKKQISRNQSREIILEQKTKAMKGYLKL